MTSPTSDSRHGSWLTTREDRPRLCAYGSHVNDVSEPRCGVMITLRDSTAAGHRGFCSDHHAMLEQLDQTI